MKQSLHFNNKARLRAPEPSFAGPMRFTWVRGMEEEERRMDFIHVDGCVFLSLSGSQTEKVRELYAPNALMGRTSCCKF